MYFWQVMCRKLKNKCIPGLETLMWFVGESRWQVHGSTPLTDSAGASGRVHNNTECLSPPSFPLLSKHTSYPQTLPSTHRHTFSDSNVLVPVDCTRNRSGCWHSARHYQSSASLVFLSSLLTVPSLFRRFSLAASYSVSVHISSVLLHYTHSYSRNTHAHAPWLVPPSSFGSHSLHQSLSSFLFLHLFCPPLHCPAEHVLYSSIGNLMSCPPTPA